MNLLCVSIADNILQSDGIGAGIQMFINGNSMCVKKIGMEVDCCRS